ncbi:MAG: hypothetical protein WD355_01215 [Balneolaceae bacterium]
MIDTLLQTINNRDAGYGGHLWTYRMSADTLDLYVLPKHRAEPGKYREAVVYAGQALQAISNEALQYAQNVMVQSFPNLGEPELVAHVRLIPNRSWRGGRSQSAPAVRIPAGQSLDQTLRSTASHYGMFLLNLKQKDLPEEPAGRLKLFLNEEAKLFKAVCTMSDNPFDWLKTGQWIERFHQLKEENSGLSDAEFYRFEDQGIRAEVRELLEHHPHPQVLVSYQP